MEISPFRIKFEYIKVIKNTLADTMSRLITVTPEIKLEEEPKGYEFGYYAFEDLKASLPSTHPYYIEDGVLMKYTTDSKQRFETIVVP